MSRRVQELFANAATKHRSGQLKEAEQLYRQILAMDPKHADALHLLGVIALQVGRYAESVDLIRKAIAAKGQVPSFYNNLGNAERAQGQLESALASYGRAFALNPDSWDALYNQGVVLQELGRLEDSMRAYERVIRARPDHAAAYGNLGNVFHARGQFDEALSCYAKALAARPDFLPALVNRGNVQKAQGRLSEAVESYQRALAQNARYPEAHNNLGLALLEMERIDEAIASFQKAVGLSPNYVEAHRNLANALREGGRPDEAIASYRRALSLNPNEAESRVGLAITAIPVFAATSGQSASTVENFDRSLTELERWSRNSVGAVGEAVGRTQPFYLAYRPTDVTAVLSRYGEMMCAAAAGRWPALTRTAADRSSRERPRLAVICGQVHAGHPVWEMLLKGIIAHLKRERLELFLYHTGSVVDDDTSWARSRVDRFVQGPKSIAGWVEQVAQDRPDIIFYPEVGMDPVTCALAATRLAPLQAASWGHPVTTGLPSIDLYLSGELLESPAADRHYREKLIRLPGTGACTQAPNGGMEVWQAEAPRGVVRFALPHTPIKFDPSDDWLLPKIAKAVGDCEFWLSAPRKLGWATARLKARLGAAFRAEGLDPDQYLHVTPWLSPAQFSGYLEAMDVYLDCPAFSGYTTAWHALHHGLPLVTLEGEFLRQRLAAGLLRQIEMQEGIAHTHDEYVTLATRLANESRKAEASRAREAIRRAASKADNNTAAVDTLGGVLFEAFSARGR